MTSTASVRTRRTRGAAITALSIVAGLIAALWVLGSFAEQRVRQELADVASKVCASIDQEHAPIVSVSLFSRSLSITGLTLLPAIPCTNAAVAVHGRVDTLQVSGISLSGLLFGRTLAAEHVLVRAKGLALILRSDTARQAVATRSPGASKDVQFASHDIQLVSTVLATLSEDTLRAGARLIRTSGKGFYFRMGGDSSSTARFEHLHLLLDSLYASASTGYEGSIARCEIDQEKGTLDLVRLDICPSQGLEELSARMEYEGDVIEARLDTVRTEGLDVQRLFAERVTSMRKLRLASGDVTILRDKTMPDGPSVVMPLLARLIRGLPMESGVDTITVLDLAARYRERGDRSRGFALIPFSNITASITGARNSAVDTAALMVRARCTAFDDTPVSLVLRSVVQDTTDRFELDASIGAMSFTALNKATGPLVDIQATAGRMDSVIFRMTADDHHAHGVVRIAYRDLKLASGGRKRDETMNRIETVLINILVRDQSRDSEGVSREGTFSFDRRRDRAILNYMWSGLREGTKAMLMPDGLVN